MPDVIKGNILRCQRLIIAAVDSDMKIINEVKCQTSEKDSVTQVPEFVGTQAPHAFILNHGAHGYGKFIIDEMTLKAFETPGALSKIATSLDRKMIYMIMFNMIKNGKIAGSRLLHIILGNISFETAEDIISDLF